MMPRTFVDEWKIPLVDDKNDNDDNDNENDNDKDSDKGNRMTMTKAVALKPVFDPRSKLLG